MHRSISVPWDAVCHNFRTLPFALSICLKRLTFKEIPLSAIGRKKIGHFGYVTLGHSMAVLAENYYVRLLDWNIYLFLI